MNSRFFVASLLSLVLFADIVAAGSVGDNTASFVWLAAAAKERDARLRAAQENVRVFRHNARVVKSAFYPQVLLRSSRAREERRAGGGNSRVYSSYHRLVLSQSLWSAKNGRDYDAALADAKAEEAALLETTQQVYYETIRARMNAHLADEGQTLLAARLAAARRQLDLVKKREAAGVGARLDIALLRAEEETIAADLAAATAEAKTARLVLIRLVGEIPQVLPKLRKNFAFPSLPAAEDLSNRAKRQNPALRVAQYRIEAERMRERSARAEEFPVLSASGEYGISDSGERSEVSNFALQLSIPLYAGGGHTAARRRALARRRAAQEQATDAQRRVVESALSLRESANFVVERARAMQEAQARRREFLQKTRAAWLEGAIPTRDVIDAEQALFDARRRRRALNYEYLDIMAQIANLLGDLDEAFFRKLDSHFQAP